MAKTNLNSNGHQTRVPAPHWPGRQCHPKSACYGHGHPAVVLFLLVGTILSVSTGCTETIQTLNYNKLSFTEENGVITHASAYSSSSQQFFFRVKTAPEKVYEIATVTPKDAANFGYKKSETRDSYKIGVSASLSFEEGGWQSIQISGSEIEFAPSRDGEFVSLPVKKSKILRLFGQPISIERPQPSWR